MGLWKIWFCTFYVQNWCYHLPFFSLDHFPSRYFHSYSWYHYFPNWYCPHFSSSCLPASQLPCPQVALSPSLMLLVSAQIHWLSFIISLCPFYQFSVPVCVVLFPMVIPEVFFAELPCIGTLYSWCLGIYITLGWSIANEWLVQKYESPVPLPSNKTNSEMGFMLQSSLWDQAEAGTCPESSVLFSLSPFPLLLPSPPYWFLFRVVPWEITSHGLSSQCLLLDSLTQESLTWVATFPFSKLPF